MKNTGTCAEFFDRMQKNGEAVILRDPDGAPALFLHRIPGGVCLDDGPCPRVSVSHRNLPKMVAEWKRSVEWDRDND